MTRDTIERHQAWLYLATILLGLLLGGTAPGLGPALELLLWPSLGLLLYVTFIQVPLNRLPDSLRDLRFIAAVLFANFILVPLLVLALLPLVPDHPAFRLGVLLVLLVPCTDWFITFTHLGQGDVRRAIVVTPLNLLLQFLLLPVYLWLFLEESIVGILSAERFVTVAALLILGPLLLAFLTQRWSQRRTERAQAIASLGLVPIPLLALVVFLVAASQAPSVTGSGSLLLAFILFLIGATGIGLLVARLFRLPVTQARTLVFSVATRNSFVVLPFALALPPPWDGAAMVIVFQSLVELFGMTLFVWLVPRKLLHQPTLNPESSR